MKYSDELYASYSKKKRIIYGIALVLHIAAMAFFCIELAVYHPISPDYWTEIAKLGGNSCLSYSHAVGMAVARPYGFEIDFLRNTISGSAA